MATKPATTPEIWASNAVYTTGPFIGSVSKVLPGAAVAAEGHRPGALFPTAAEHENYEEFWTTTWVTTWLALGSSAGAADAHILETAADGRFQVEGEDIIPVNANPYALFVQAPPGAGNAIQATGASAFGDATFLGISTGLGAAVEAQSATAGPGFYATHSGTGEGVLSVHTGAGTAGLFSNSSTGLALDVVGSDAIQAANFQGGVGQAGVVSVSGLNAASAIGALGNGTAIGVDSVGGTGSSAAIGVRGTGAHADADGVHGRTSAAASTTAAGVYGEGRGAGSTGVHAESQVGRGLLVQGDASSPAYPAMRIIPQDADPTAATNDGELYWNGDHRTLRTCIAGHGYRSMPTMGPGSAFLVRAVQAHNTSIATGGSYTSILSVTCTEGDGTGFFGVADGATVLITFSVDVRTGVAAADWANVRITDVTNAAVIAEWTGAGTADDAGFYLSVATTEWQRTITIGVSYAPPADGDLEILVEMSRITNNGAVRNAVLEVKGTYEP